MEVELAAALFEALTADSPSYISCIDRRGRIVFLNRSTSRELGDIIGRPMVDFVAPEHREQVSAVAQRAFATGEPQSVEYAAVLADGSTRHLCTRVSSFLGPGDQALALMITDDRTLEQRLTDELQKSTEFRQQIVDNLPDYVVLIDRQRRLLWANRFAPGVNPEEAIGAKVDRYMSAKGRPLVIAAIEAAFENGTVGQFEAEASIPNGSMWLLTRVLPVVTNGTIESVLLINSDITERKKAELALRATEQQLHRAQRLESLGQLAGGIAHDFNNLLQVIEGNLYFAQQNLEAKQSITDELAQAMRATERAAELTSHLLAIGRRKRVNSKRVELGQLVSDGLRMLRRAIPENVALEFERPRASYYVELDAPQFEQVLINLCVNARDAMPDGGTLRIGIEPEDATHVVLVVSDTGTGIDEAHLPRIFEPFFTTKGAGSGLGLAVAAGIVAAHGGVILPESTPGRGTTMRVRLPRVMQDQPSEAPEQVSEGPTKILVAEDEDLVRSQIVRILTGAGYSVLEAADGASAVQLFTEHRSEVALVLLDVIMPVMDGWQVFLKLDKLSPGIKVVFLTGYAASVLPEDFAARGARLMSKPFKPHQLLCEVRELLDQDSPGLESSGD